MSPPFIDTGSGTPVVLIPGVQGRWEWMRMAVAALSRRFRVLTFTLAGEYTSGQPFDPSLGFDTFVGQIDGILDRAAVRQAIICGVSYGGLIALRYAALHPERVRGLVLVSAPPPDYRPDAAVEPYLRAPRLMAPLFALGATRRGMREVLSALPTWDARLLAVWHQARHVIFAPAAPHRMRDRVRLLAEVDFGESARRCSHLPTLVITGEPELDRVVGVEGTLRYCDLLQNVTVRRIDRTGHLGLVLRPEAFADAISEFVTALERRRDARAEKAG